MLLVVLVIEISNFEFIWHLVLVFWNFLQIYFNISLGQYPLKLFDFCKQLFRLISKIGIIGFGCFFQQAFGFGLVFISAYLD